MSKTRSKEEIAQWRELWKTALRNMPRRNINSAGSPYVLLSLLGYSVQKGYASNTYTTNMCYGRKPLTLIKQERLKALAGPHSSTMAKVIAIQRGFDLTPYKVWP
jgi:hypothetical protein